MAADHGEIFQAVGIMTVCTRSSAIWGENFNILDPGKISTFVKLPYPQIMTLVAGQIKGNAHLAVLFELVWLQFDQNRNPFEYKESRLNRYARMRGLKILQQEKWIKVAQERGKFPVITLLWIQASKIFKRKTSTLIFEPVA
jgi:hypothetical protein